MGVHADKNGCIACRNQDARIEELERTLAEGRELLAAACMERDRALGRGDECVRQQMHALRRAEKAERERADASDELDDLRDHVLDALPYVYADGSDPPDSADPYECVDYAAREIKTLTRERDEARREAERMRRRFLAVVPVDDPAYLAFPWEESDG